MNLVVLIITMTVAYISATFMVEAVSISCAVKSIKSHEYHAPLLEAQYEEVSSQNTQKALMRNAYYIREKVELAQLSKFYIEHKLLRSLVIIVLIIYMYGAMCLKYIAGAQSLVRTLSPSDQISSQNPQKGYYLGVGVFLLVSIAFSIGNIEKSKNFQVLVMAVRVFVIAIMLAGTLYVIIADGAKGGATIKLWDSSYLPTSLGNSTFIFMCHHSIPGITFPLSPQSSASKLFLRSYVVSAITLIVLGVLSVLAFDKVEKLYNVNFLGMGLVGDIVGIYPFLNVASVPVVTITLRENILYLLGWNNLSGSNLGIFWKGVWSFALSVPAVIMALLLDDPQEMIKYTGGISGSMIMFVIPAVFILNSKRFCMERLILHDNFHQSQWSTKFTSKAVIVFALLLIIMVIMGAFK
jgi:hypothetical protein